jgi:uncharacterized membrane protein YsdA (DUF1294 family)
MSIILLYFLVINCIGFFLFWYDKNRAIAHKYRVTEKTLLAIVALGGVIGSGLAMLFFRHKTSKMSYLLWFFGIIVVQILVFYFSTIFKL